MGIKNWTVTAQSVKKGAAAREVYLHDENHPNHKNTEGYLDVWGSKNHTLNIIKTCENYKMQQAQKRKGGRPPTDSMEFVFTLPKGIRPDQEQWKNMLNRIMVDTAKQLKIDLKQLSGITRAVAHQQNQDPAKQGAGDHMHVVIGKFTPDGTYLRDLQKKGVLHVMKQSFNHAVLMEMEVNHATYEPVKRYQKAAKRRVPQWKVQAGRTFDELTQKLAHKANTHHFENKAAMADIEEARMQLEKISDKVLKQCDKWLEAYENSDERQLNRQYNRINKGIEEINAFKPSKELGLFEKGFAEKLNKATEKIDSVSQRDALPKIRKPSI